MWWASWRSSPNDREWFVLLGRQKGLQFFCQLAQGTEGHLYHKVSGRWYNANIVDITRTCPDTRRYHVLPVYERRGDDFSLSRVAGVYVFVSAPIIIFFWWHGIICRLPSPNQCAYCKCIGLITRWSLLKSSMRGDSDALFTAGSYQPTKTVIGSGLV